MQEIVKNAVICFLFAIGIYALELWVELSDQKLKKQGYKILDQPFTYKPTENVDYNNPESYEPKPLAKWSFNEECESTEGRFQEMPQDSVKPQQSMPTDPLSCEPKPHMKWTLREFMDDDSLDES